MFGTGRQKVKQINLHATACQKNLGSKLWSVNECVYFPDTFLLKKKQGEGKKLLCFQNIIFFHVFLIKDLVFLCFTLSVDPKLL